MNLSYDSRRQQLDTMVERELEVFHQDNAWDRRGLWEAEGNIVRGNPLEEEWWRVKAREYPLLASLAR